MPAAMDVGPVLVLAVSSVSVPAPVLVRAPLPNTPPDIFSSLNCFATSNVWSWFSVTASANVPRQPS